MANGRKWGIIRHPSQVKPGDLIFARNAPEFFEKIHPQILHPFNFSASPDVM